MSPNPNIQLKMPWRGIKNSCGYFGLDTFLGCRDHVKQTVLYFAKEEVIWSNVPKHEIFERLPFQCIICELGGINFSLI